MSCPAFWLDDPHILIAEATEFFPFTARDQRCTSAALNAFTRFGLYLGLLLALLRLNLWWLLTGVAFAGFAAMAWVWMGQNGSVRELFSPTIPLGSLPTDGLLRDYNTMASILDPREADGAYIPDLIGTGSTGSRTQPTAANPFMNVLFDEIQENPYRPPAANVQTTAIKKEFDAYFQTMFYRDPNDVFNHTQNQRNWVTLPSSLDGRGEFADWLYRVPGQTCKEGNMAACQFSTGAESLPSRSVQALT